VYRHQVEGNFYVGKWESVFLSTHYAECVTSATNFYMCLHIFASIHIKNCHKKSFCDSFLCV